MRVVLAQLAPALGEVEANLRRVEATVARGRDELVVFPELFLTGYRVGDRVHRIALAPGGPEIERLRRVATRSRSTVVVGAPVRHRRAGETLNATVVVPPNGDPQIRGKRYLPTYGPFEEGAVYSPAPASAPVVVGGNRLGTAICYDVFFPEVARSLALDGAELLVVISAAPVTSRRLFDRVLPARAIENAVPVVYVNRVGVEDGLVFGGGSQALDARGELVPGEGAPPDVDRSRESVWAVDIDLGDAARWRPFRPVLRDVDGGASERHDSSEPPAPTKPRTRGAGRSGRRPDRNS